ARKIRDGALEQRRLSGAGRADEIERNDLTAREPSATFRSDRVVLRENARFKFETPVRLLVRVTVMSMIMRVVVVPVRMAMPVRMMIMLIICVMMRAMKMTVAMVPM
ncbi:hypothetical protein, partial [Methylocystis sp.]|uniref:hypothetical protein n=1 Tax=Methylocystis sp. TaxID=1911079 RepID=UPI002736A814